MSSVPEEEGSGNSFPKEHLPPTRRLLVRESFENHDGEVQSLLETLSRRDTEIDGLKEKIKFQDTSHQTIKQMLQEYNDRNQFMYKKQVARLVEMLKSRTENHTRKIKEIRNGILENVDETVRKELEEKNEMERKVTELEQKITEFEQKIMELENETLSRNTSFSERIYEKDTQIRALSEKKIEYQRILEDRDTQLADCQKEIAELNARLQLIDEEENEKVLTLKNEIKKLTEKIIELEKDRDCKIASLKSEIHEQNQVLSGRDSQITALKTEIEELVKENNNKDELLSDLKNTINTLKEEKDRFQKVEQVEEMVVGFSPTQEDESEKLEKLETQSSKRFDEKLMAEAIVCLERLQVSEIDAVANVIPKRHTRARAVAYETLGKENQTCVGKTPRDKCKKNGARERTPLGVSALNDSSDINVFRSDNEKGKTPDRRHITKKMVQKLFASSPSCDPSETQVYTTEKKKKLFSVSPSADHLEINYEQPGDTSRVRGLTTPMQTVKLLRKKK